jgi:WD40 repeat protein
MNAKTKLALTAAVVISGLLLAWLAWHRNPSRDVPLRFWAVSFSPDGATLVTTAGHGGGSGVEPAGQAVFWDVEKKKMKGAYRQSSSIRSVAWAPDGSFVVIGDFNGSTKVLQAHTREILAILPPHSDVVTAVAVSNDGKMIASGSCDGSIILSDAKGKELDTLVLPHDRVFSLALAPDAQALVATGEKGKAYLFRLNPRSGPGTVAAYEGPPVQKAFVEAVCFAPDGRTFVTGCHSCLRLWDSANGNLIREFKGVTGKIKSADFSSNGKALATVDSAGKLAVWNPATGECNNSTDAHRGGSYGVAYSPSGQRIASVGREDYCLKLWDPRSLIMKASIKR